MGVAVTPFLISAMVIVLLLRATEILPVMITVPSLLFIDRKVMRLPEIAHFEVSEDVLVQIALYQVFEFVSVMVELLLITLILQLGL